MKDVCVSAPDNSHKITTTWQRVGASIAYTSVLGLFAAAAIFAVRYPGPIRSVEAPQLLSEHELALAKISSYVRLKSEIENDRNDALTRLTGFRQNLRPKDGPRAHSTLAENSVVHETTRSQLIVWSNKDRRKAKSRRKYFSRSKSYRTVCVRLCDGYYFPVSAETRPRDFVRDEAVCASACGAPARLFVTSDPEADAAEMQDLYGRRYANLRTAFRYRRVYDQACTCKAHPWQQEAKARHKTYALASSAASGDHEAADMLAKSQAQLRRIAAAREIAKAATIGGLRPLPPVKLVARGDDASPPAGTQRNYGKWTRYAGYGKKYSPQSKRFRITKPGSAGFQVAKRSVKKAKWGPPMGLGAGKANKYKARSASRASRYYRPARQSFKAPFGDY